MNLWVEESSFNVVGRTVPYPTTPVTDRVLLCPALGGTDLKAGLN